MLKKTVTYTDYNGVERTEDFYFNLSKAEVTEMELSVDGGLAQMLENIVNSKDNKEIIRTFKQIVLKAYGEKSPDGRRFIKSKELSDAFSQTEAYSEIFMELALDDKAATDFINGILPTPSSIGANPFPIPCIALPKAPNTLLKSNLLK